MKPGVQIPGPQKRFFLDTGGLQDFIPVILATREAEIRRMEV
jgi:hypothetical protein